ncbi:hypothetical protein BCR33DRAFT_714766 [Rhizoclosmatium globosum]|uniref:Cyclin-like domain-containing protein n=1 Tax=Rhizoclosmatium globosum TaxID=329046 RepID=A0A1Y2CKZ1_9FUNG|nr:hypothetical protein BCR33DRAFT_714766 [Rhizoclosmatium globosum]|eukprot:ORY47670.1 hypothetical protein BCR33DRAFT_714766 [Rhizoclosmatium globosum]
MSCCSTPQIESESDLLVCTNCGTVHHESVLVSQLSFSESGSTHSSTHSGSTQTQTQTQTQPIQSNQSTELRRFAVSAASSLPQLANCADEALSLLRQLQLQLQLEQSQSATSAVLGLAKSPRVRVAAALFVVARLKDRNVSAAQIVKALGISTNPQRLLALAHKLRLKLHLPPFPQRDASRLLDRAANALFRNSDELHSSKRVLCLEYADFLLTLAKLGSVSDAKHVAPLAAASLLLGYCAATGTPVSKPQKLRILSVLECSEGAMQKRCSDFVHLVSLELEAVPWYPPNFLMKTDDGVSAKRVVPTSKAFCVKFGSVLKDLKKLAESPLQSDTSDDEEE